MKKLFLSLFLFSSLLFTALAAEAQDPLKETYQAYLALKNDLVKDMVAKASAETFVAKIKAVKTQDLTAAQQKVWAGYATKILKDAEAISASKDIEKQRKAFSTLSENMYPVAKSIASGEAIYYQFCPMKKSYWLSSESAVKNPYYGKSMLTCGSVKEVLK